MQCLQKEHVAIFALTFALIIMSLLSAIAMLPHKGIHLNSPKNVDNVILINHIAQVENASNVLTWSTTINN